MEGLADAFKRVNPDNIAEVEVTVGSDGARHYLRSIFIFAAAVKMANAGDGRLLRAVSSASLGRGGCGCYEGWCSP
jgi:hypothetical protein